MRSGEPGGEPKVVKQGRGRQEGRVCTGQAVRGFGGPAGVWDIPSFAVGLPRVISRGVMSFDLCLCCVESGGKSGSRDKSWGLQGFLDFWRCRGKGVCCDGLFGKMGNQLPVILIAFYSELNSVLLKFTSTRNLRMRPCLEIGSLLMSLVKDLEMKPSWI